MLYATEKYNKNKNTQFITFAYKYIQGFCLDFLKKEFVSLKVEDINNSPISDISYEMNYCFNIDLIAELNKRLKIINKSLSAQEEKILRDNLLNEYSLRKCAELNNCSTKKITNTIGKYKNLIKDILDNEED